MVYINDDRYLERANHGGKKVTGPAQLTVKQTRQSWWLVKSKSYINGSHIGIINMGALYFPKRLQGKRLRFRVEIMGGDGIWR